MADSIVELCENMSLTEGEQVGLCIHEDDTADLRMMWGKCLVGRLLTERRVQKDAFRISMAKLWRTIGSVIFKELDDNLWLFEFASDRDKSRVEEGRPWLFDRSVLVLRDVDDHIPPTEMIFHHSPIWVQVHNMPLTCMNRAVGFQIGGSIGVVEEVDVTGDGVGWGRCLRIRVAIDLTKPLDRGRALIIQGKPIWVKFRYEKLPSFFHFCGRIYHGRIICEKKQGFRMNDDDVGKQWGMWLRADDVRFRKGGVSSVGVKNKVQDGEPEKVEYPPLTGGRAEGIKPGSHVHRGIAARVHQLWGMFVIEIFFPHPRLSVIMFMKWLCRWKHARG
jgi:hypothetical protein